MHTYLIIEGTGLLIALAAAFTVSLRIRAWRR
jgi:hypothetical protein